jgi:hypothetical protein
MPYFRHEQKLYNNSHTKNKILLFILKEKKYYKSSKPFFKNVFYGQAQWLMHVISATREVEIWRILVQGQPRQKASENPS